jgi:hypothetical protein
MLVPSNAANPIPSLMWSGVVFFQRPKLLLRHAGEFMNGRSVGACPLDWRHIQALG